MKNFHSVSCCLFALVVLMSSCSLHKGYFEHHLVKGDAKVVYAGEKKSAVAEEENGAQPIDPRSINITASLRGGNVLIPHKEPCSEMSLGSDTHEQ